MGEEAQQSKGFDFRFKEDDNYTFWQDVLENAHSRAFARSGKSCFPAVLLSRQRLGIAVQKASICRGFSWSSGFVSYSSSA